MVGTIRSLGSPNPSAWHRYGHREKVVMPWWAKPPHLDEPPPLDDKDSWNLEGLADLFERIFAKLSPQLEAYERNERKWNLKRKAKLCQQRQSERP
jgi:hypothetical protein